MTKAARKMTPKKIHQEGLRLYGQGRMKEALEHFQSALRSKETGEFWNDWAAVQHALGASEQAETGFRKAFELDRSFLQAAANLGVLLVEQNRPVEAAPFLLAALNTADESLREAVERVISNLSKLTDASKLVRNE